MRLKLASKLSFEFTVEFSLLKVGRGVRAIFSCYTLIISPNLPPPGHQI